MRNLLLIIAAAGLAGCRPAPGEITLVLDLDGPPSAFTLEPAPLKYDKDFAWSFTLDDGLVSAYLVALPYFSGGRVAPPFLDQWGHDQGGDGLLHPGLFFTDGCAHLVPFRAAVAINASSIVDTQARLSRAGYLSWPQVARLSQAGWDVYNHGYTHATGKDVDAWSEVRKNNDAVAAHIGLRMTQFVVPGGRDDSLSQEPYVRAAFAQDMRAVHGGRFPRQWALPARIPDTLRAGRLFLSSRTLDDSAFFDDLETLLHTGKKYWINAFTHSVGDDDLWNISIRYRDFSRLFDSLAARYGAAGRDNIWMAPYQTVQEYLLIRQTLSYSVRQTGSKIRLTFDPARLPPGLQHKTMTFVWKGAQTVTGVRCQGCTLEGFSGTAVRGEQLINVRW